MSEQIAACPLYFQNDTTPFKTLHLAWSDDVFGRLPNIKEHAHHALQIEIGLQEEFRVFSEENSLFCRLAIIQPDVAHRIDDCGTLQAIIYLAPKSIIRTRLQEKFFKKEKIQELQFQIVAPYMDELIGFAQDIHSCREAKL